MSLSELKITKHAKMPENKTYNKEIYQKIGTDSEVRQVVELVDSDPKIVIISIFYTLFTVEKNMSMIWTT